MDDYKPITQEELDRGYFFLTHRLLIKKIVLVITVLILVILYISLIFNTIKYFRGTGFNNAALEIKQSTFDWRAYHSKNAPQDILVDKVSFISLGDGRYNIIALVENLNTDWAIKSLDYYFVSQGESTPIKTTFINPEEKRLLILAAFKSNKAIRSPEIFISNIEWYHVDASFPEINIEMSNIKFQAASRKTVDEVTVELPARVSWQAYNESVYNFWEVDWQIALYNGNTLVAINELKTKDFLALETRDLETVWLNKLPRVTNVSVFPLLNKMSSDIFKDIHVELDFDSR